MGNTRRLLHQKGKALKGKLKREEKSEPDWLIKRPKHALSRSLETYAWNDTSFWQKITVVLAKPWKCMSPWTVLMNSAANSKDEHW